MRTSRAASTRSAGARRGSAMLFDIDEDNVSVHMDSPDTVERTLSSLCDDNPLTHDARTRAVTASALKNHRMRTKTASAKRRAKSAAAPATSEEVFLRRTIQPLEDDPSLAQQQPATFIDNQGHVDFSTSMYRQAIANGKLDAPSPRGAEQTQTQPNPTASTPAGLAPQEHTGELQYEFQRQLRDQQQRQQRARSDGQSRRERGDRLRNRSRARSRKQSIFATWSYCGFNFSNVVLRFFTSAVVVPLVVCGLLFWPVVAAALLTVTALCVCVYEHAWLAFRIRFQLLATYEWYEETDSASQGTAAWSGRGGLGASTRSNLSEHCGYQDVDLLPMQSSFISSGFTQSTTSFGTGVNTNGDQGEDSLSFWGGSERESFADPVAEAEAAACPKAPSTLYLLDLERNRGVLATLAHSSLFNGNLWLARVLVSLVMTALWSLASTLLFPMLPFPVANTPSALNAFPAFFWLGNLMASLCALSCPNWPLALALLVQKCVFQVLLQNAFNCPLAAVEQCVEPPPLTSLQAFVLGVLVLLALRGVTARNPADLVISFMLDLLGYAYICGALGLLISMVDPTDADASWATVWLGMLSVTWVAQFAGYCCDAIMFRFQLPHFRLLPPRVVVSLDVEALLCAVTAGSLMLVFGGQVLGVPGGVLPKVLFSVASVLMARFGRLVISLLKKAAGVRWSGRLMPGFGGALDGSHALLFTSIVFVKYYLYTTVRSSGDVDGSASSVDSTAESTTSINFSSLLDASIYP